MSEPVVLVVEDEALILETVVDALECHGFRVIAATTGDEALRLLELARIDVLFTDIDLPGKTDGRALARSARARWPGLNVIYASGRHPFASAADMVPGARYLPKPYRPAKAIAEIEALIGKPVLAADRPLVRSAGCQAP